MSVFFIAHRGASFLEPENTLRAFERARQIGVGGFECDLQRCASGEWVVFHDHHRLDPTTDFLLKAKALGFSGDLERLTIRDLTWQQIQTLDAGRWKDDNFSDTRIPKLSDFMDFCRDEEYLTLEVKFRGVPPAATVASFIDELKRFSKRKPYYDNLVVGSFNPIFLYRLQKQSRGEIPVALISEANPSLWRSRWLWLPALSPRAQMQEFSERLEQQVRHAHQRGRRLFAWTLDDLERLRAALALGVDGVISNRPELFAALSHPK